mmetsp:Transcript_44164/g.99602  ORF Transcript_44164/g.99602 Transcript_44164/m.99602 type:complete len:592 (+) Transcript_44164:69-1844(+)
MGEVDPFEFFKEELQAFRDDCCERRKILGRMTLIAGAMGKDDTAGKLVPFLTECITTEPYDKDDEFLYYVAKGYRELPDHLPPNGWQALVPSLESLGNQDETLIREEAVKTLASMTEHASDKVGAVDVVLPVLQRLAAAEWFSPRCASCLLFPAVYQFASDTVKADLRKLYVGLCNDDAPMVKRSAAKHLAGLTAVMDKKDFFGSIQPTFAKLAGEDTDWQDVIRVEMVKTLVVLAEKLDEKENREMTGERVSKFCADKSWRVRLQVTRSIAEFCKAVGPAIASELMKPIGDLLKDQQQEVRVSTIENFKNALELVSVESLQTHIVPRFQDLAMDTSTNVRSALAKLIGHVAAKVGRNGTLQGQPSLLSTVMELLKDEIADVRLHVVNHTGSICEVLGLEPVQQLLSTLPTLSMDNQWRIRMAVVSQIPILGQQFGTDLFQSKLEGLFLGFLGDSVNAVRVAAVENLEPIVKAFGPQWTTDHFLPRVLEQNTATQGYLNRLTALHALSKVATVMTPEQVAKHITPVLVDAMKDKVPNVKFCSCKIIQELAGIQKLQAPSVTIIKPALSDLRAQDSDPDVQMEARKAAEVLP